MEGKDNPFQRFQKSIVGVAGLNEMSCDNQQNQQGFVIV